MGGKCRSCSNRKMIPYVLWIIQQHLPFSFAPPSRLLLLLADCRNFYDCFCQRSVHWISNLCRSWMRLSRRRVVEETVVSVATAVAVWRITNTKNSINTVIFTRTLLSSPFLLRIFVHSCLPQTTHPTRNIRQRQRRHYAKVKRVIEWRMGITLSGFAYIPFQCWMPESKGKTEWQNRRMQIILVTFM